MQVVDTQIWLEVADWETVGFKYNTVRVNIETNRKSWSSIHTTGKGREKLYLYSSLSAKHQALFADMVRKYQDSRGSEAAKAAEAGLTDYIKACITTDPKDIQYFMAAGYSDQTLYKANLYARRAAWLRFLSSTTVYQVKQHFGPCKTKLEFYQACLPVLHADNCFGFKSPNIEYLYKLLARYNKEGIAICADGRNNKQNALKISASTEAILLSIMRSLKKPTKMQVYEYYNDFVAGLAALTNTETGEMYCHKDHKPLSYGSVQGLLSRPLLEAAYAAIHGSSLTYRSKHGRYLDRERPVYFGSMISCDDWDVPIDILPYTRINAQGQSRTYSKIVAYLFFDTSSRHCVGYSFSHKKDTDLFMDGLVNMLTNPLFEHKSPYELQTESHLIKQLTAGVLAEGQLFGAVSVLPKNPMAKLAETDIRSLKYGVLQKDQHFAEYFKGRHYARAEAYRLEKDDQSKVKKLDIKDADAFMNALIAAYNEQYPIKSGFHPDLLDVNHERQAYYLADPIETSYRNGVFRADNRRWDFGLNIEAVLPKLTNENLIVRIWKGVAHVYHNELYLGVGVEVERSQMARLEQTEADAAIISGFVRKQKQLDRAVAGQVAKAEVLDTARDWADGTAPDGRADNRIANVVTTAAMNVEEPEPDWESMDIYDQIAYRRAMRAG